MVQENITGNKRSSKDLSKMLPPHLRAKGIKNSNYSSPLKNQVELKEEKLSIYNSKTQNENLNINVNEVLISRSKSTNEALDQKRRQDLLNERIPSEIKKSNSYSSENYKLHQQGYISVHSNLLNGSVEKSNDKVMNDTSAFKNKNNQNTFVNNTTQKEAHTINTMSEVFNSSVPFSSSSKVEVTPKPVKRRSTSLPTNPLDMFNPHVRIGNYMENKSVLPKDLDRSVPISRSTSRSGSDNKIHQILGEGAVNSFERNNSQQLNDSITNKENKGNREKIQQLLIDGNNKNKSVNKDPSSLPSSTNSPLLSNTIITNNSMKKLINLNDLTTVASAKDALSNSNLNIPTSNGSNINDYPPPSILLNGSRSNGNEIERSGSSKSVSIVEKNGTIRSLGNGNSGSSRSVYANGNIKSITLPLRSNSGKLGNEAQLSFTLPLTRSSSQSSSHMKANSLSSSNSSSNEESIQYKNPFFSTSKTNSPMSNIITIQQETLPQPFNNDEAMATTKLSPNSLGFIDRNSKNDIFSYAARKREEEQQMIEKKNSIKISRETLVYSCYVEKLSSRHKYQKRILRFDGIFLTCLSPKKKQKLPANTTFTMVNPPYFSDNSEEGKTYLFLLKKLYSNLSPGPEFSGPLIAVEDGKSKNGNSNPNLKSKYFYVPKWIINIKDIISVRPLIHPSLAFFSSSSEIYKNIEPELKFYTTGDIEKDKKTFIIITRDNAFYVIRGYNEREFNRWLYILTRSKEILEELVQPSMMEAEEASPKPSPPSDLSKLLKISGGAIHGNMNRNSVLNVSSYNKSSLSRNPSLSRGYEDVNEDLTLRRFRSREEDYLSSDVVGLQRSRSRSRSRSNSHAGHASHRSGSIGRSGSSMSNTNVNLMSLYTNKTTPVQLKTEYTDLIDRCLPKDPLHFHYTIYDYWKGILDQLYLIDKDIYSFVTKAENSELMAILRETGELDEEEGKENEGDKPAGGEEKNLTKSSNNPDILVSTSKHPTNVSSPIESPTSEVSPTHSESNKIPDHLKDKPLINAIPQTPTLEMEQQMKTHLKPRPRSGSAPVSVTKDIYEMENDGIKSAGPENKQSPFTSSDQQYHRKDLVSMTALGNVPLTHSLSTNTKNSSSKAFEDNFIHSQTYTIDTIEQPQIRTIKMTKNNRPVKQHRSSTYQPNTTESIRIPSVDTTLKQPLIQSIPWNKDLKFIIMGLLRIFHRLSGIPFEEDGETTDNTPPPPIPRWYYQFCVKSIPVYIIQVQNMIIDYLHELEYQQCKQDEIEMIQEDVRESNKSILSKRYNVIQNALDSFIKLSNLWEDIINQWKLEMIRQKLNLDTIPLQDNEMDTFLLQHVQVSDVLSIHTKIKDYLGKEILIGCRNLLKLFEKEE
ncbi:hypothetical protein BCR36DRAFT_405095 [Piromyces finnis]|uniref:PH domain-containing protein n=1 Tax=Piromyces finnis TaxID=1754191 RepID=A0A1Y1V7W9_9FUNG|nr:hypothetical protein BCR36DRAFT_405095 [Piromyces finnis]|eukprot:ORX48113.1 hypothetical protein BCR36DRAFT_405095 [Piromyces finnis]